jgi:aspartate aminotransferase
MAATLCSERLSLLRPTAINRVLDEARKLQADGQSIVSLARGQPDAPTPLHIVEAACKALRDGRTGYPDNRGEPHLRQAVAEKLKRDQGLSYDPDREVLITDGATLGICVALGALVQSKQTVMVPDPIYDAYSGPIALWGGRQVSVPAGLSDGRFAIDAGSFEACTAGRQGPILINTPWNPVGTVMAKAELAGIMKFAEEHQSLIVSDEIYESLVYDGRRHVSPAAVSSSARQRTIIVNSLSKTYAMTGWRVGYCAGPEPIIQAMFLLLQQASRGPATFVQDAAVCALESDQDCVRQMAHKYSGRRDQVVRSLGGIPGVELIVPEAGLFVMADVRGLGRTSDAIRRYLLAEHGVVVIHGTAYGPGGEGFLRVSFAAGGETLERGLERLRCGLVQLATERATGDAIGAEPHR